MAGMTVVSFPEGTTTSRGAPLPFKSGLFHRVAGREIEIVPARIEYDDNAAHWVGDATFVGHLIKLATRSQTVVRVTFSRRINARKHLDGAALAERSRACVCEPEPVTADLSWLRYPWLRHATLRVGRRFTIGIYDQPGRWMTRSQLVELETKLRSVAFRSLDEVPTYGLFASAREAFSNRVIAVVRDSLTRQSVAFTAMVYLPYASERGVEPLVHLGLTMIDRSYRGQRLQTALFRRAFWFPILNQGRLGFVVTNIAASPAGIGATSDYFQNVYPHYAGKAERQRFHLEVARQVLSRFRHEFGCATSAVFDEKLFVVRGSNDPAGGGAYQFIKDDPVSRYRVFECNRFCAERLNFAGGDELFQVGRVDLVKGLRASSTKRRRVTAPSSQPS